MRNKNTQTLTETLVMGFIISFASMLLSFDISSIMMPISNEIQFDETLEIAEWIGYIILMVYWLSFWLLVRKGSLQQ